MRLTRFTGPTSRRDRRNRIAAGAIAVFTGLIGIGTAPYRVEDLSWKSYLLPILLVVVGCVQLFLAWRRREGNILQ
jgi:uncharacterized membrane protein